MHSCFASFIFAARTLDFTVKFRFVFRYEAVVFRRYVLALLSVGLLRKFGAYPVYPSLIRSKNLRYFSFFQKFRHFTYMLLWFHLVIPSFPARIMTCAVVFQLCRFLSIALHIPAAHDFCVISARKLARARTQGKKFPSS